MRIRRGICALLLAALVFGGGSAGCTSVGKPAATRKAADLLGVMISNNGRIEHYEDMTTDNVRQAALDEHAEVVIAETIPPKSADSIYEWTRLVVRLQSERPDAIGGGSTTVWECWEYIFEGKFLRGNERQMTCPSDS